MTLYVVSIVCACQKSASCAGAEPSEASASVHKGSHVRREWLAVHDLARREWHMHVQIIKTMGEKWRMKAESLGAELLGGVTGGQR
jgi:hypothetical protein